ncbi:MAG: DNA polymerase IV [Gemmatimonadetes bacterium]|nr:DNA polymerase IV [Gemmatimonadota bacterium]
MAQRIPGAPRRILLVDCDAFFVQVARLEDPHGAGKAECLVVGGSASGRGVVTSASYEARKYGVRSAMPAAQALRLCPRATIVPVPRDAVGKWSRAVRSVLTELAPVVQAASVDEFYLDMSGTERLFPGSLAETAEHIRQRVREVASITTSIGGGTRRVIAKLATGRAKPDGVFIVPPGGEEAFMRTLDLRHIPGIGPQLARELAAKGLVSVESAWAIEPDWFERWFGTRRGRWLHRRIRGLDDSEVDPQERRRSISSERTFGSDIDSDAELSRRLLTMCGSVAARLRSKDLRARTVTVKIRDFDFRTRQRNRTLDTPVESDTAVFRCASCLLSDLRARRRVPVRLLGVGLGGLEGPESGGAQLEIFPESAEGKTVTPETPRDRHVTRAIDELADRFGGEVLVRGSTLRSKGR